MLRNSVWMWMVVALMLVSCKEAVPPAPQEAASPSKVGKAPVAKEVPVVKEVPKTPSSAKSPAPIKAASKLKGLIAEGIIVVGGPEGATITRADKGDARVYTIADAAKKPVALISLQHWDVTLDPKMKAGIDPFQPKVSSRNIKFAPASTGDWPEKTNHPQLRKTRVMNGYYVANVLCTKTDSDWVFDGWRFMSVPQIQCSAPKDCPLHLCDCGGGNVAQADHYPCNDGYCSKEGQQPCEAFCASIDFNERK